MNRYSSSIKGRTVKNDVNQQHGDGLLPPKCLRPAFNGTKPILRFLWVETRGQRRRYCTSFNGSVCEHHIPLSSPLPRVKPKPRFHLQFPYLYTDGTVPFRSKVQAVESQTRGLGESIAWHWESLCPRIREWSDRIEAVRRESSSSRAARLYSDLTKSPWDTRQLSVSCVYIRNLHIYIPPATSSPSHG